MAFDPLDLSPLIFYNVSDLSTLFVETDNPTTPATVDGPVGTMLDLSGNGFHAVALSDSSRPILRSDGNRYWLEFDGVDDGLEATGFDMVQPWSRMARFRITEPVDPIFGPMSGSPDNGHLYINSVDPLEIAVWDGLNGPMASVSEGTDLTAYEEHNGAGSRLRIDLNPFVSGDSGSGGCSGLRIACHPDAPLFTGLRLYGLAQFDRLLDSGEAEPLRQWFASGEPQLPAVLPPYAKIAELRLVVSAATDEAPRPLTRRAPFAAAIREMWRGEIAFAPLLRDQAHALAAFLESVDGKVSPFAIELQAGKFGQVADHSATLAAVPVRGSDRLALNLSPPDGTLKAGTLLTLGDIGSGPYQLFEVVQDAQPDILGVAVVRIAPRVRHAFSTDVTVTLGTVHGRFIVAADNVSVEIGVGSGLVTLPIVEAP